MKELLRLPAHRVQALIEGGEVDARELFLLQLRFARFVEPEVSSFLTLADEEPPHASEPQVELAALRGNRILSQIPVSVKDIIATRDLATSAGSRILSGYVPPYDATAVRLLKEARNFIVGKTNLDEFGMGSSTEYSGYFPTHNPWDLSRVPGGSSGGAASSVAALQSFVGLGSDTGGSVRQPAALCGVVGFKPTYGFISRYGLIAYASSLDHIGITAREVTDVALMMNVVARPDPLDATSQAPPDADYVAALDKRGELKSAKIGVVKELMDPELMDSEVIALCEDSLRILGSAGVDVVRVSLPEVRHLLPAYYILAAAEASSNLARYDGIRYGLGFPADTSMDLQKQYLRVRVSGFGEEVKRRILLGTYVLSAGYAEAYYNQARQLRRLVAASVADLFSKVDFLFSPTSPFLAFKLGERMDDPTKMYACDVCVVLANLANVPAISLPAGLSRSNLPVGIQLMAPSGEDARLLAMGRLYEEAAAFGFRTPPLVAKKLDEFKA